jgi:hypothetical protein
MFIVNVWYPFFVTRTVVLAMPQAGAVPGFR